MLSVSTSLTSFDGLRWVSLVHWADGKTEGNVRVPQQAGGRQGSPLLGELLPRLCADWPRGHGKKRVPRAVSLCGSSSAKAVWCVSDMESGVGLPWATPGPRPGTQSCAGPALLLGPMALPEEEAEEETEEEQEESRRSSPTRVAARTDIGSLAARPELRRWRPEGESCHSLVL